MFRPENKLARRQPIQAGDMSFPRYRSSTRYDTQYNYVATRIANRIEGIGTCDTQVEPTTSCMEPVILYVY